jgi:hypothetical protein
MQTRARLKPHTSTKNTPTPCVMYENLIKHKEQICFIPFYLSEIMTRIIIYYAHMLCFMLCMLLIYISANILWLFSFRNYYSTFFMAALLLGLMLGWCGDVEASGRQTFCYLDIKLVLIFVRNGAAWDERLHCNKT